MALKIYLLLPDVYTQFKEVNITKAQVEQLLVTINQFLHLVRCEKEAELYYDVANLKDFDTQIREIANLIEFSLGEREPIELLTIYENLNGFAREIKGVNFQCCYIAWNFPDDNTVLDRTTQLLLKMVEDTLLNQSQTPKTQQKYLLLNFTDLCATRVFLPIIKDCGEENCPQIVCIPQITDKNKLEVWLRDNRQPRVFNKNPKHGEQGKGVRSNKGEKVSPLLCSPQEAQQFLDTAIGCATFKKELYNFDRERNKYIVFSNENTPDNTYHGHYEDSIEEILKDAGGEERKIIQTKLIRL